MPSIKDFENKIKKTAGSDNEDLDLDSKSKKARGPRRRPGRDEGEEAAVEAAPETAAEAAQVFETFNPPHLEADHETLRENERQEPTEPHMESSKESPFKTIHVKVLGKEWLTIEPPEKLVELADNVVEDWKNDGSFESLPVGSPLAQLVAARGLRKAKDIEKKLEEKGVFAMAQMGIAVLKSKIKKD